MIKWWKLRASSIHVQVSSMSEKAQDIPRLVGSFCSLYFFPFIIQKTFDQCTNLGICPLFFSTVFFCRPGGFKDCLVFYREHKGNGHVLLTFSKAWFEIKSFFSHDPLGSHHCIRGIRITHEASPRLKQKPIAIGLTFANWNDARCFLPLVFFSWFNRVPVQIFCRTFLWRPLMTHVRLNSGCTWFFNLRVLHVLPKGKLLMDRSLQLCSCVDRAEAYRLGAQRRRFHPESTSPKLQTRDFLS